MKSGKSVSDRFKLKAFVDLEIKEGPINKICLLVRKYLFRAFSPFSTMFLNLHSQGFY